MKVFLFTGAGASVELGVPSMKRMASGFRKHVAEWRVYPDLVDKLMSEEEDVEDLIERLDHLCGASEPLGAVGGVPEQLEQARSVQSEVEWYVQHSCERISAESAHLMWGALLATAAGHQLTIATTNYDRAIELAANRARVEMDDGFGEFGSSEIAKWEGFGKRPGNPIVLIKGHGSTDWYQLERDGNSGPVKLRHPMPLFGNGSLRLPNTAGELGSALVLPSREKRITRPPYLRLSQEFLNRADESDVAVFVGSSFRDPHIRQAFLDSTEARPTFVVSQSDAPHWLPEAAYHISETASQFFISTLASALRTPDPITELVKRAEHGAGDSVNVLSILSTALDRTRPTGERCSCIEELAARRIALGGSVLHTLTVDPDPRICLFGLGLIPDSPDAKEALEAAERAADDGASGAFREEVVLLRKLVDRET